MTQEEGNGHARSRRKFLQRALGAGGGVAAASFAGAFGVGTLSTAPSDATPILNLAATAEALAATFYHTILSEATFHVDDDDAEHLKLTLAAELHHLEILRSLGGTPLTTRFYLPARALTDARTFVGCGLRAEAIFVGAYLAATHQFASFGQPVLAATAAQHGASEAQHHALIAQLGGLGPGAATLPEPLFRGLGDATPALAAFLHGGDGYTLAAQLPTSDEVRAALGDTVALRARSFAEVYGSA